MPLRYMHLSLFDAIAIFDKYFVFAIGWQEQIIFRHEEFVVPTPLLSPGDYLIRSAQHF